MTRYLEGLFGLFLLGLGFFPKLFVLVVFQSFVEIVDEVFRFLWGMVLSNCPAAA